VPQTKQAVTFLLYLSDAISAVMKKGDIPVFAVSPDGRQTTKG